MIDTVSKALQWLYTTFVERGERLRKHGLEHSERWARFFDALATTVDQARQRILAGEIPELEYSALDRILAGEFFQPRQRMSGGVLDDEDMSELHRALLHATHTIRRYDLSHAPWSELPRAYMQATLMNDSAEAKRLGTILARELETSVGQFRAIALSLRTLPPAA